jgi:hypothetical protein
MTTRFERRESDDPWRGRQPRYEKIVRLGPLRFGLKTTLPSGEPTICEIAGGSDEPPANFVKPS